MKHKSNYHIVELRNYRLVDLLREQIKALQAQLATLHNQYQLLTLKYGAEVQYNNALCDLLRQHGIPFRSIFDHDVRYRNDDS